MQYDLARMVYHPPTSEQRKTYEAINAAFIQLADTLSSLLPDTADSTLAMRQVEMSRMYCNAAIALEECPLYVRPA